MLPYGPDNQGTVPVSIDQFVFIPVFQINGVFKTQILAHSLNVDENACLEHFRLIVEEYCLSKMLSDKVKQNGLVNRKETGKFREGNAGGSHGKGGSPKKPVGFGVYGWESEAAAATALKIDRKMVSKILDHKGPLQRKTKNSYLYGRLKRLTPKQFDDLDPQFKNPTSIDFKE